MICCSPAATIAAAELWSVSVGDNLAATGTASATIQLHQNLRVGLSRWIGVVGYTTLLDRAIGIAREDYPWINMLFQPEIAPADLIVAIESFGTPVVVAGSRHLVAVIIELLGRIVGISMAVHLVKHIGTSHQNPAISAATEGEFDE